MNTIRNKYTHKKRNQKQCEKTVRKKGSSVGICARLEEQWIPLPPDPAPGPQRSYPAAQKGQGNLAMNLNVNCVLLLVIPFKATEHYAMNDDR